MKLHICLILLISSFFTLATVHAEDITTVEAKNSDISDNLDLEAVATLFGESKDLEEFEKKLNDPDIKASNLDLNEDGQVDYLRVLETAEKSTHLITIQAVVGQDQYQDVATIDVEKDEKGETQVQVVGDVYMYGPNYVITPVYAAPPPIFTFFFVVGVYSAWHSPYYWGFYPPFFRPWAPFPVFGYHNHVNVNINVHNNHFNHTTIRNSNTAVKLQNKVKRNDFAKQHPDKSFASRNDGLKNKRSLDAKKAQMKQANLAKNAPNKDKLTTNRPVNKDWKPMSERSGNMSQVRDNKISIPNKSEYKSRGAGDHALSGAGNGRLADRQFNRGQASFNRSFSGGGRQFNGGGRLGGGGLGGGLGGRR